MLARDGKVVADDAAKVTFSKSGSETDAHTGKPVPDAMCFEYRDGECSATCSPTRARAHPRQSDPRRLRGGRAEDHRRDHQVSGRLPPLSLRAVVLERYDGGEVTEHYEEHGSFEECYWQRTIHGER